MYLGIADDRSLLSTVMYMLHAESGALDCHATNNCLTLVPITAVFLQYLQMELFSSAYGDNSSQQVRNSFAKKMGEEKLVY